MKKNFYNFIAYCLGNARVLKLFRRVQFFVQSRQIQSQTDTPEHSKQEAIGNISIWLPEEMEGEIIYTRPRQGVFGDHYSHRPSFSKQKEAGAIRICYFGESAALGYLYAPHFSPAEYLEQVLNKSFKTKKFEVIDLSQTNETLDSMAEKMHSSIELSPDMWVIFAGNNWSLLETPEFSPGFTSLINRQQIGRLILQNSYDELADQVVKKRLNKIGRTLEKINLLAKEFKIEPILVIPEVNLADWESRQPIPDFPDPVINQWYQVYENCLKFIETSEWDKLLESSFKMWEMDQGTCSTTYRLISIAHMNLGNLEKAKAAARAEIDSIMLPFMGFLNAPQITSYDQEVLRRAASFYGFKLIDVPNLIAEKYPGKLPDRELFLDYCHFTIDGIRLVIQEIEKQIYLLLNLNSDENSPGDVSPEISKEEEALAQFGAAIHTAHRLVGVSGKNKMIDYWCRKAYHTSPGISKTMLDFVEARASNIPAVLTAAQQRNLHSPYRLLHSHGWKYSGNLDIDIILAIQEVLKHDYPETEEWINQSLLRSHSVEDHSYDLIDTGNYLWNPLVQAYADLLKPYWAGTSAVFRAIWPRTDFVLISTANRDLDANLVAKVSSLRSSNDLRISVNSKEIGTPQINNSFHPINFCIPGEVLQSGVNKLTIDWPPLSRTNHNLSTKAERLLLGEEVELVPVFGEIFSLKIN